MKRLYIGGLKPEIEAEDLKDRFCSFGNVLSVDIAKNQITG